MFSKYRGRNHLKKQNNNCKHALSIAEKRARSYRKRLAKLFPRLKFIQSYPVPCEPNQQKNKIRHSEVRTGIKPFTNYPSPS